jgi:hypothetical protein
MGKGSSVPIWAAALPRKAIAYGSAFSPSPLRFPPKNASMSAMSMNCGISWQRMGFDAAGGTPTQKMPKAFFVSDPGNRQLYTASI